MEGSSTNHLPTALLVLITFTFYINSGLAASFAAEKASTEFIKTSCGSTSYPGLCFTSLSSHTSTIQTSPKLLAQTALTVSLNTALSTTAMMLRLSKAQGMKPREVGAMRDCLEELTDSVDQLKKSMGEMNQLKGSQNYDLMINDIQTWVSAALTDEDTCSEGFAGKFMNGNTKNIVRGKIVHIVQLTSNALALINSYASLRE